VPAPRATQHTPGLDGAQRVVPARPILRSQSEPQQPRGIGPGPLPQALDFVARSDSYGHGIPGMRHSSLELTTRTYTDPKLLDVAGAVNSLPGVVGEGTEAGNRGLMTEGGESAVVPGVVPTSGISSPPEAIAGPERENDPEGPSDRSAAKEGFFAVFPRHHQERAKGLEPSTSSLGS